MSRQIPWLRVFVEGVVIVGSILLAFGIDAWWDGRQERAAEAELLVRLDDEFRENQAAIAAVLTENQRFGEAALTIGGMQPDVMRSLSTDSLSSLLQKIGPLGIFHPGEAELSSMIQSGENRLLRDRELRVALSRWAESLAALEEQAAIVRRGQSERADLFRFGGYPSAFMRDEDEGDGELVLTERREVLAQLLGEGRFRENILYHRLTRNYYNELLEEARTELDSVLVLLAVD